MQRTHRETHDIEDLILQQVYKNLISINIHQSLKKYEVRQKNK